MIAYFTTATTSYLPRALALAESLRRHHPGSRLTVGLVDRLEGAADTLDLRSVEIMSAEELGVPDLARRARRYDATELVTSLKPWFAERLLDRGAEAVIFLDPDTWLTAPLDALEQEIARASLVLTPHWLTPLGPDQIDRERRMLRAGVFNTGVMAISGSSEGRRFLAWWRSRLDRTCRSDPKRGYFVDQAIVNLAPIYFSDVLVCRDPGVNVAWWNLYERPVGWSGARFHAGDAPLRLFHFSRFDPCRPEALDSLVRSSGEPATPGLVALCDAYAARLLAHGHAALRGRPCALAPPVTGSRGLLGRLRRATRR
jgi:hypothetical protein